MDDSWVKFLNETFKTMRKDANFKSKEERLEFNYNKIKTYLMIKNAMEHTYGIDIGCPESEEDADDK